MMRQLERFVIILMIIFSCGTPFAQESEDPTDDEITAPSSTTTTESESSQQSSSGPQSQGGGGEELSTIDLDNKPTFVSASKVDVDIHTGSASLSVPIAVPQGRAGIQPSLALSYNSSSKHGIFGLGWIMEIGGIQRSTKNGPPKYDFNANNLSGTDTFILMQNGSSQQLIHGGGGVFRPELEGAFMEIKFVDANPDYWLVTDKKGIQYTFGKDSASQEYDPANSNKIFKWVLNRVEDVHGNFMTFSYARFSNKLYPTQIDYTGASNLSPFAKVLFTYQDRPDRRLSYISQFLQETTKRLKEIDVKVDNNLQRRYVLSYAEQGFATNQSMLTSVAVTDSAGNQALPPTIFEYDNPVSNLHEFQETGGPWRLPYLGGTQASGGFTEPGGNHDLPNGVELVDVNADGFTDVIWSDDDSWQNETYLNNKVDGFAQDVSWEPPVAFVGNGNAESGVRFMDVNGDGLLDIVKHKANEPAATYLNNFKNGGTWASTSSWIIPGLGASGFTENNGQNDNGVRIADVNADGLADLLWADGSISGERDTRLNDGNGNFVVTNGDFVVPFINGGGFTEASDNESDNGIRIVDVNGDGLPDILQADGTDPAEHVTYLNNGKDFILSSGSWIVPNHLSFSFNDTVRLVDVNNDGLVDIVEARGPDINNHKTYLNDGIGNFVSSSYWQVELLQGGGFNESDGGGDNAVRFADIDGNGYIDFMWADGDDGQQRRSYYNRVTIMGDFPHLLTRVDSGTGATTEIAYEYSNRYPNTFLPFSVPIVKSVTTRDEFSGDNYTTSYDYEGGKWEGYPQREFRGFAKVIVKDPLNNYSVTYFYQDDLNKGRVKQQESYDANSNIFSKTINTYDFKNIAPNVNFVYLWKVDNFIHNGDPQHGRRTRTEFFYDESIQYGNLTKTIQLGEVNLSDGNDIGNDDRVVETEYHNVTTPERLIGLPKHTVVKNENGVKVRESWFYYDGAVSTATAPTLGLLTMKEDWAGNGPGAVNPKTRYEYDAYGNLKKTIDPLDHETTITYDPTYFIFPLTTTNAIGHQAVNEYYGVNGVSLNDGNGLRGLWGQLKSSKDPNNQTVKTSYDTYGRPTITVAPLDSVAFPTSETIYEINSDHIKITTKARLEHGVDKMLSSVAFYDGLGRLIQSKSKSETPGVYILSGETTYNSRGLPERKYISRFTNNGFDTIDALNPAIPSTLIEYDAMGRVLKTTNPDGSFSNVIYSDWTTSVFDENGHKQESEADAYGRLVQKREYLGADGRSAYYPASSFTLYATTQYQYDSEGNLTTVIDAHGNTTTIQYDQLGRKESMDDPDMGVWSYEYDLNGNLKAQTDAKGERVEFDYDVLNRLIAKRFPTSSQATVNYTYDDPAVSFSKGRLTRANYQSTNDTEFEYDLMGREIRSVKKIDTTQYDVERGYDALSRLVSVKYPDANEVFYSYNAAGQIEVVGDATVDIPVWEDNTIEAPYAHYKMNDNAATATIVDTGSVGNPAAAPASTSTLTTSGKINSAIGLPGTINQSINCDNLLNDVAGTNTGTLAFWVRVDQNPGPEGLINFGSITPGNYNVMNINFASGSQKIAFGLQVNGTSVLGFISSQTIALGNWVHVAVTQDGASPKLYINGVADTQYQVTSQMGAWFHTISASINSCRMGSIISGGEDYFLNGALDDFRYYPRALTAEEVGGIYNQGQGTEEEIIILGAPSQPVYPPTTYIKNVDYNANGQMIRLDYGNGLSTAYFYDPVSLRLVRMTTGKSQPLTIVQDFIYTYDAVGNILAIVDNVNTADQFFAYDELNRLKTAVGNYGTKNYAYDEIGNIIQKDNRTYTYACPGPACPAGGGGPHAVTGLSDGTLFEYDANGNMKKKTDPDGKVWVYEYDSENRLKKVKKNGNTVANYAYDGDGGRTKKTVYQSSVAMAGFSAGGGGVVPLGPDIVKFVGSLFEESSTGSGLHQTNYLFLGDQRFASLNGNNVLYFYGDHLGSTNIVTDAVGTSKELIEYEPYGQESRHDKFGTPQEVAHYYFTSQYKDDESGLYFYNARYYMPAIGKFISPDTIVQSPDNPQTFNRYSYSNNNPINNIDPSGHSWKSFWKKWGDFVSPLGRAIVTGDWKNFGWQVLNIVGVVIAPNAWLKSAAGLSYASRATSHIGGNVADEISRAFGYAAIAAGAVGTGVEIHNAFANVPQQTAPISGESLDVAATEVHQQFNSGAIGEAELTALYNDAYASVQDKIVVAEAIQNIADQGIDLVALTSEPGLISTGDEAFLLGFGGVFKGGGGNLLQKLSTNGGFARIGRSLDVNKLNHIFGNPAHNLGGLLKSFGGNQARAFNAIQQATQRYINTYGVQGVFRNVVVQLGEHSVTVRGTVINGVAKIGTAFIP